MRKHKKQESANSQVPHIAYFWLKSDQKKFTFMAACSLTNKFTKKQMVLAGSSSLKSSLSWRVLVLPMCCRLPAGVSPSLQQHLSRTLVKIGEIYPGTDIVLVLRQDGTVAFQQVAGETEVAEVVSVVSSLKKAAVQLSGTLGQSQCPILHVKGGKNLFSCYDLGSDCTLAFFTPMAEADLEILDSSQADVQMVPIIDELKIMLLGSVWM
jgi:predicted regulator of Ras-like GTPase activity (Roadblock/LC7/MglB family)